MNEAFADDKKTALSKERLLLEETRAFADKAFTNQTEMAEDFTGKQITFRGLSSRRKMRRKYELLLRAMAADEKTRIRLLEISNRSEGPP